MRYNSYTWLFMYGFTICIGALSYAFVCNSVNDALSTLLIVFEVDEDNKPFVRGLLTSSLYIGAFVGAITSKYFEALGLRNGIIIIDIFLILGSIMQAIDSIILFTIGRFIAGLGSGL